MAPRASCALVFAFALSAALAGAAPQLPCEALTVDGRAPLHVTAPYYASFNIDSSRDREMFTLDWTSPKLVAAARGLATNPTHIRFGGTGNNWLHYGVGGASCPPATATSTCLNDSTWQGIAGLAVAAASPIVFGVNFCPAGNEKKVSSRRVADAQGGG